MSDLAYVAGRCLLQDILNNKHMSQSDLARKLNVSRQQINKYVSGEQKMGIELAYNISRAIGCNIEDLYEWLEVGQR